MEIELDFTKSARGNAARYYEAAKKYKRKSAGAERALKKTKSRGIKAAPKKAVQTRRKKYKWFEQFHYFTTSGGLVVVAGKDAKQNELLVSKYLTERDLFFHADVVGASATILKDGLKAGDACKREAAQWACCYSRAWKSGSAVADAYCVNKEQVSKYSHGEYVGKGAFVISGEREWFKNTLLELRVRFGESAVAEPAVKEGEGIRLSPGGSEKIEVVKALKSKFPAASQEELAFIVPGASALQ